MFKNFEDAEFCIFDVETTGLDPKSGDKILEIAAVRVKQGRAIDEFSSLVNPNRPISYAAFQVNQISQEMVEDAPDSSVVLPKFLNFIKGSCLAAYNANFDLGFLNNELEPSGVKLVKDLPVIDILIMARSLLPNLGRYPLWYVAQSLGVDTLQEHRALLDVHLTLGVFNRLVAILQEKSINDFLNCAHLFGVNPHFSHSINFDKSAAIQRAIDLKMKLKIRYFSSSKAQVSDREISPKELKQERGKDVVVGFCHLRNEERNFRLDRILHIEVI